MKCSYGCEKRAVNQLKNGKWCCSEYASQCIINRKKNSEGSKGKNRGKHNWTNLPNGPWNKGLTKEIDERVIRHAMSVSKATKGRPGRKLTEKTKSKLSKIQKNRIKNGCKIGSGYAKKYWHDSPIAGRVSLDGTWELQTAIFFDGSELNWRRNTRLFKYNKLDGSIGYYNSTSESRFKVF